MVPLPASRSMAILSARLPPPFPICQFRWGGIRDGRRWPLTFTVGVEYVIIGTQAVKGFAICQRPGGNFRHVIVGLDAVNGMVAIDGWATITEHPVTELSNVSSRTAYRRSSTQDIGRDGMLTARILPQLLRWPSLYPLGDCLRRHHRYR